MTAYGTVEAAVQAMREGAYDFIEKPLKRMSLVKSLRKAAERWMLVAENRTLRQELKLLRRREIVGNSHALRECLKSPPKLRRPLQPYSFWVKAGPGRSLSRGSFTSEVLGREVHLLPSTARLFRDNP